MRQGFQELLISIWADQGTRKGMPPIYRDAYNIRVWKGHPLAGALVSTLPFLVREIN